MLDILRVLLQAHSPAFSILFCLRSLAFMCSSAELSGPLTSANRKHKQGIKRRKEREAGAFILLSSLLGHGSMVALHSSCLGVLSYTYKSHQALITTDSF